MDMQKHKSDFLVTDFCSFRITSRIARFRHFRLISSGFLIVMLLIVMLCQKKENRGVFIVGRDGDTLTSISAVSLDPVANADSVRFRNIFIRKGLAKCAIEQLADSLDILLSRQLSLESGVEWSGAAAGLLFDAARVVRARLEKDTSSCSLTVAFAESLFNASVPPGRLRFPNISCQKNDKESVRWISCFFAQFFGLDNQTSTALAVFTNDLAYTNQKSGVTEDLIKGLVFDAARARQDSLKASKAAIKSKDVSQTRNNPEDLLRFRDQKSILDSISERIPEIKALYKKHLKANSALGGTVTVKFQLGENGKVINASIVTTGIDDKRFLEPFLEYIKTIRFKEIPEKAGTMTFEFPFEFDKDS